MKNITLKYYDLENNIKIIYPDEIKTINVIEEIDITHMSVPTTIIDIVLKCTPDEDLDFDTDLKCDVCLENIPIFEMYVNNSLRASNYEWKLSLYGVLGYIEKIKYYGDIYGDPSDYTSLNYYKDGAYYVPKLKTIEEICEELSSLSNIQFDINKNIFTTSTQILHQVRLPICNIRDALLHISFLLGAFINDKRRNITFYGLPNVAKEITQSRIINDAKIEKTENNFNINLYYYKYDMLESGLVWFLNDTYDFRDGLIGRTRSLEYECDILPSTAAGGIYAPVGNFALKDLIKKSAEDNIEVIYPAPVSSINLTMDSRNPSDAPKNPNYSPADENLVTGDAVKYNVEEKFLTLEISKNATETKNIKEELLSPQMANQISDRIKTDFSYNRKARIKIVEGFEKSYYGQHKYGEIKYGYASHEEINIGDKIQFKVHNKIKQGYITRMKYNLNGIIKIKDCEVVYKEE